MKELKLYQLNKDQFEPFGDIMTQTAVTIEINNGNCFRYNNLANYRLIKDKRVLAFLNQKK